jgi:hypothetical protein
VNIKPLVHTGDSSNLAFYAEPGDQRIPGHTWTEVCRNDVQRGPGGGLVQRAVPTFSVSVHEHGTGETGRFTYEPKTKPAPGPLPARTVTRLIRAWKPDDQETRT